MTPPLPPASLPPNDRGNSFEIPRFQRAQTEALNQMFGEPIPTTPRRQHRTNPDAIVHFTLDWNGRATKHRSSKMSNDEFAAYERERMAAMAYVGKHVRHFDRWFGDWTVDDLDRLASDMLATLRKTPIKHQDFDARVYLQINRFNGKDDTNDRLSLFIAGARRDFRAEADLDHAPIP